MELVFGPIMACFVIGGFVWMWYRKRQREPVERGRELRTTQQLGGKIGHTRFTRPFMELRLYDDLLVISTVGCWKARPEELTTIEVEEGLLQNRLRLRQEMDPREVILRPDDARALADRLRRRRDARLQRSDPSESASGDTDASAGSREESLEPTGW